MSPSNSQSKILFQMTGSIACYKACQIISKLVQTGYDVQVVASSAALQFIGNATIEGLTGKPVVRDLFGAGNVMDHIHLVRWADLILVAPATANFINKVAHGVGDDIITTQFLAHDFKKPLLIAPAMNTNMYLHPVTQSSIRLLRDMGIEILETASGVLACGEVGWGRLLDPDLIVDEVKKHLGNQSKIFPSRSFSANFQISPRILVTFGGTQEPIDQVRFLSNASTGATGAQIADTLTELGFDVTCLHAENALRPQLPCRMESFVSFVDFEKSLQNLLSSENYSAVVHAAALSDFSPEKVNPGKLSSDQDLHLRLKKNPKLVNHLREMSGNQNLKVIAFKMTATDLQLERDYAVSKLFSNTKADLVVQNDVNEMDSQTGKHLFHVYDSQNQRTDLQSKSDLGIFIGEYLIKNLKTGDPA